MIWNGKDAEGMGLGECEGRSAGAIRAANSGPFGDPIGPADRRHPTSGATPVPQRSQSTEDADGTGLEMLFLDDRLAGFPRGLRFGG